MCCLIFILNSAFCILHLKKGRERHCAPGPCHFNKEQTPLAILRYQPAVSRRLFRCLRAHLLRSPSIVKIKFVWPAARWVGRGQTPPVTVLCPSSTNSLCRQTE